MSWNNEHPLKSSVGYASCLHIQRKNYVEIRKSYAINSSIHIQNKMREDFRTRTHNFIGHFYDFISKLIMLFAPIRKQNGEYQKSDRIRNISLCLAAQISAFHNDSLSSSWTLLEFILRSNSFELVAAAFVLHYGNLQWISICTRTPLPQINVSLMWGSIKVHLLWNGSDFIECMLWTNTLMLSIWLHARSPWFLKCKNSDESHQTKSLGWSKQALIWKLFNGRQGLFFRVSVGKTSHRFFLFLSISLLLVFPVHFALSV